MSDLGELLVVLHGARSRISTVRATVRTWQHAQRTRDALERFAREGSFTSYAPAENEPERESIESRVRVWLAPPDRAREERSDADGEWFGVRRGKLWWRYDPRSGATSNQGQPEVESGIGEELWRLLDPAPVIGLLDFGPTVAARRVDRPTLRVRAVPRVLADGADWPLIRLGVAGADELVLDVDAERGALLRIEARYTARAFAIFEVTEIAFDEALADDLFTFTPPPGEEVRSITDQFSVQRDLTIEQAVARAPFTVWIPSRLPAGWETEIAFAAENDRPPMAPHVHLHYRASDGTHVISVAESPADHPGEHSDYEHARPNPWQEVERGSRRMQIREPTESWQPAQLRMELKGTRILIHSTDLAAGALVDLADGLVPAPSEPPRLGS